MRHKIEILKRDDLKRQNLRILILAILSLFCFTAQSQVNVTGSVVDATKNEPLPGATVMVKGATTGTVTDLNGQFSISVPSPNDTLQVSFVGYNNELIGLNGQTEIEVYLIPDLVNLKDVVVIGYGTQKKSDVTGAVASIDGEQLTKIAATDVTQALQGQSAGVVVIQNSGSPNSPMTVRVRGIGSINNSNPLYVVDGIVVDNPSFLNQADIASIEVLKDASAAAIYGSSAANGVVLIQTKKGKKGKTTVDFSAFYGIQQLGNEFEVMDAYQLQEYHVKAYTNENPLFGPLSPYYGDSIQYNTDWVDEITRIAPIQNYHLSLRSGSEKMNYNFSLGYFNQEGIILKSDAEKITARFNMQTDLNNNMKFGFGINYSNNQNNSIADGSEFGPLSLALKMDPTAPVYDPTNEFKYYGSENMKLRHPVAAIDYEDDRSKRNSLLGTLDYTWEILPSLTFQSKYGFDFFHDLDHTFNHEYQTKMADDVNTPNDLTKGYTTRITHNFENMLTYSKAFGNHDVTALIGQSSRLYTIEYAQASATTFFSNDPTYQHLSSSLDPESNLAEGAYHEDTKLSWLGRLIYSYRNKYLLTASLRRDGSSKFGTDNRWGSFPSFNLGWKITEEEFMKRQNIVSFLKLRGGWGIIGNDNLARYSYTTPISTNKVLSYTFGADPVEYTGMAPLGAGNTRLQWEESEQTNIGLDAAFLNNRVLLTLDYYKKNTNKQLLQLPVPGVSGLAQTPTVNAGNLSNEGIEAELTYKKKEGHLHFEVAGNITYNRNRVEEFISEKEGIRSGDVQFLGLVNYTLVEYPTASFYGYVTDGLFQSYEEINNHAFQTNETRPGDIKFVDINNDGLIDGQDQTFIGNPYPEFVYGIRLSADYKNIIDFSAFFQGVYGNEIYNGLRVSSSNLAYNLNTDIMDSWTEENPTNDVRYPRFSYLDNNFNKQNSDRWIEDGSYLRLKDLQLGYSLPQNLLNRINVKRLRIFVAAQNLLTFTKYSGFDPEIGTSNKGWNVNKGLDIGIDRGNYPVPVIYRAGMQIKL
ncbi:MAG: SusC/RagA family TonB-linked outer membrane protein [Bacteroidetes bacterium]|jgi:TonB-linked SusC/RagA family outer membrane protein|nr:SusC/RagA family TonB-linked outer membrane protein [Bacteroidota bacterium]